MRLVSTAMLTKDMVLASSIYYNDCMLLRAGQKDIIKYTPNLQRLGIYYVYVEDEKSQGINIPSAIKEQTKVTCKKIVRDTMEEFSKKSTINLDIVSVAVNSILNDILNNEEIQVSMNDISAADEYTFSHSVSTTVYSLLIGKQLGYSRAMLEKLATGTLVHDLGKVLLDKDIVFKPDSLTPEEFEHVKAHTSLGYEALKKCTSITELSRIISLFHHERMDGSGYPRGVKAKNLHEFARIVAIADVYDALTADRCYRKKWTNDKAVNYLIGCSQSKFDVELVSLFIKQIAIYPNGSMVRLSDDTIGIIKEQNRQMPLRPIVRVIADKNGNDIPIYEIDLMEKLSITIKESEIEIPKDKPNFEIDK
jgi:HD-GYP domain